MSVKHTRRIILTIYTVDGQIDQLYFDLVSKQYVKNPQIGIITKLTNELKQLAINTAKTFVKSTKQSLIDLTVYRHTFSLYQNPKEVISRRLI